MITTDHLYLIGSSTGHVKIGRTQKPMARMRGIQTSNPGKLTMIAILKGQGELEFGAHAKFSHLQAEGEWFEDHPAIHAFFNERGPVLEVEADRPSPIGRVVASAISDSGHTIFSMAEATTIARTNLRRHVLDGEFTMDELYKISGVVGVPVSEMLDRCSAGQGIPS